MPTHQSIAERIRVGLADVLERELRSSGWPHFKGGSRRFGYDSPDSDTDFFVLGKILGHNEKDSLEDDDDVILEDAEDVAVSDLMNGLKMAGLEERPRNPDYSEVEGLHYLFSLDGVIHVMILTDKDRYEKLQKEHELVDALLNRRPFLRQVAHQLKEMKMKGAFIFDLLRRLAQS